MKLKPDYIKIDGSLIKNIDTDKDSFELVKAIVQFSKELNIKTIAEYVHNKEVFDIVFNLGVDEFQGYHFGKPSNNYFTLPFNNYSSSPLP
jgi:EAL domain-containing protein (putative c-di-GMP-specific phosphodiesterase class I)